MTTAVASTEPADLGLAPGEDVLRRLRSFLTQQRRSRNVPARLRDDDGAEGSAPTSSVQCHMAHAPRFRA